MIEFLKGWKTRIFAALVAVMGFIATLDPTWIADVVGRQNQGYIFIGIAIITALLRELTTTPPGKATEYDG